MASERVTQCPHCKATFKVSDEQLAVANGRVRCGACMNIFDAMAYAVVEENAEQETLHQETFKAGDGKEVSNTAPAELEDDLLIQDDPEEDKQDASYSENDISEEFSDSFLNLDTDKESDPYKTDFQAVEEVENHSDESWAEDILDEDKESDRVEPHISASVEEQDQAAISAIDNTPPEQFTKEPDQKYESLSFEYEQDSDRKRHWIVSTILVLFNTCLLVVLVAQISWFHYEKLAKYPQAVVLFEKACEVLECTLPELADLSLIKSNNLVVRSHPTNRGALIIDTVIVNEADFEQSFPDIALYFSDINGKTVAQRLIKPEEYLSQDILAWKKMPSFESIHISLEIIDPGREAVNYSLKFFPAEQIETDQAVDQMSTN